MSRSEKNRHLVKLRILNKRMGSGTEVAALGALDKDGNALRREGISKKVPGLYSRGMPISVPLRQAPCEASVPMRQKRCAIYSTR